MKKYSFLLLSILMVAILSLTSASCSRKVGCYYSLSPAVKQTKSYDFSTNSLRPSGMEPTNSKETVFLLSNCEQVEMTNTAIMAQ